MNKRNIVFMGTNQHGYLWDNDNTNCVLLATLNFLRARKEFDRDRESEAMNRFFELRRRWPDLRFVRPLQIPMTIEYITDGEFHGRVIDPNATETLRANGIEPAERYGLDAGEFGPSSMPSILAYQVAEDMGHVVAVLGHERNNTWRIVDNGVPDVRELTEVIGYKIER